MGYLPLHLYTVKPLCVCCYPHLFWMWPHERVLAATEEEGRKAQRRKAPFSCGIYKPYHTYDNDLAFYTLVKHERSLPVPCRPSEIPRHPWDYWTAERVVADIKPTMFFAFTDRFPSIIP